MAGRPSLRAQSSAQRFVLRRLEYAVLGHPMPQRHDPLRAQKLALLTGCALAAGILVVDLALGGIRHDEIPGDAALVMARESGALFVRVDDQLRPVANLTSARLILGSPATPHLVDEAALQNVAGGPMLGIPGAPRMLGEVVAPSDLRWAVCDGVGGRTTVAAGGEWEPGELDTGELDTGELDTGELDTDAAVVVTVARGDGSVYLLYDGKRAMIDPGDPATARGLHLDSGSVRTVSPTFLNAIPEVPAIGPPRIMRAGQESGVAGFPIGTVVRAATTDSREYYVVLPDGLQRVGKLTVDLIRYADPAATDIVDVVPELIARSPLVDALPVATYPDEPPSIAAIGEELCATWQSGRTGLAVGRADDGRGSVTMAGADGDGPAVDVVRMRPGRSLDVIDPATSSRYLITDSGVRLPVSDSAAGALGLTDNAAVAPWAVVGALPGGPELGRDAALVGRDVLGPAS
ncbi:type VII secretion protein EccB [Mycolicibacterium sp. Dal123E01]|uniref:type VII secretion protein EccB n=1 Tax=Mycolicibacterium sp. Dal123E01 TaxID=3457578 RepID=UPI00403E47A6